MTIKDELQKLNKQIYQQLNKKFSEIPEYKDKKKKINTTPSKTLMDFNDIAGHIADDANNGKKAEDYALIENALSYLTGAFILPKIHQLAHQIEDKGQKQLFYQTWNQDLAVINNGVLKHLKDTNGKNMLKDVDETIFTINIFRQNLNVKKKPKEFVTLKDEDGMSFSPYVMPVDINYFMEIIEKDAGLNV